MLRQIIRKEVRETVRDGRFRWGAALVGALLFLSLAAGFAQRQEVERAHASAQAMSWAQWLEQGDKNPHSAAHYGIYVFRPVSSLSFVDRGVDPYMGVSTWLEAHYQNPFEHRAVQDTPALARFADLTAATTLQLLVPLLILLLAFRSFSGEREQGTLRQLLSVGVDPRRLATGKVLGVGAALSILLVPAAVVGALALLMAGPGGGAVGDEGVRYLLLLGTYLAYFVVFTALAVGISALAPSSRTALALLLCFWIANGLLAPRIASDVARNQVPLPSSLEFQAGIQADLAEGFDQHPPREARQEILRDSVLAAHGVGDPAELPFNFAGLSLQSGEEFANLVFDRRFGELARRVEEQLELHRRLGFLAPHLSVRSLSMALTGTDPAHHERYSSAAEEHRRLIQRVMNEDIMVNARFGETYIADGSLWAQVPEFEYRGPGAGWALAGQGSAAAGLLIWLLVGAILARTGATAVARRA
jgi:ABC-2 type transport system permease protein